MRRAPASHRHRRRPRSAGSSLAGPPLPRAAPPPPAGQAPCPAARIRARRGRDPSRALVVARQPPGRAWLGHTTPTFGLVWCRSPHPRRVMFGGRSCNSPRDATTLGSQKVGPAGSRLGAHPPHTSWGQDSRSRRAGPCVWVLLSPPPLARTRRSNLVQTQEPTLGHSGAKRRRHRHRFDGERFSPPVRVGRGSSATPSDGSRDCRWGMSVPAGRDAARTTRLVVVPSLLSRLYFPTLRLAVGRKFRSDLRTPAVTCNDGFPRSERAF